MRLNIYSLILAFFCLSSPIFAQKSVYIPAYLRDTNTPDGAQFSMNKTAESENFIIIWGNTVGTNPANYSDPDLRFNPLAILDTMEYIYDEFKELEFLDDAPGTILSQYKIPIVMYNTWGPNGAQGFANGGDADGVIGAFWVHPNAMRDGGVAAHELTHSLQAQTNIDYRTTNGLGPVWQKSGIFWETHANFMRNLLYPRSVTAWGMDVYHIETFGDWKNTYENYPLLFALMESEGIDMVNRLWRESMPNEYPLQAYKRLSGYSNAQFNDSLYLYARRMATYDFSYKNVGNYFRQYRADDLKYYLPSTQATYTILNKIPGSDNRYEVPIELAPEEFAYNVIPLHLTASDTCGVLVKFKGQTGVNSHAGWRYGFVTEKEDGTVGRYSETYSADEGEVYFHLENGEEKMYFVVMGAPVDGIQTNENNDTWHGYPKHFRYPYEIAIEGATPEGHQRQFDFRESFKNDGTLHPNGGGFVQNSVQIDPTVYVGPHAIVLGNSVLTGNVRIENTALVNNANLSGSVIVRNNAFVNGGTYSQNAIIEGQAFVENASMSGNAKIGMRAKVTNYALSGTAEVGGDVVVYNQNGSCNSGVHYVLTNYYDDKLLQCDGRAASHPDNADVNNPISRFGAQEMAVSCDCIKKDPFQIKEYLALAPTCRDPQAGSVSFDLENSCGPFEYSWRGTGGISGSRLNNLATGTYYFTITDGLGRIIEENIEVPEPKMIEADLNVVNYNCASGALGTATVNILQSNGKVNYEWSNGSNDNDLEDLYPGSYTLNIRDTAGCIFTSTVDIETTGDLWLVTNVIDRGCHVGLDGSVAILTPTAYGPVTYLWEDGYDLPIRQDLTQGMYSVSVSDSLGCNNVFEFEIGPADTISLDFNIQDASCQGINNGSLEVIPLNGNPSYTISWSNGGSTASITDLEPGIYTVTVTDSTGCSNVREVEVESLDDIVLDLSYNPIICFGDSSEVTIQVSGGLPPYMYSWQGNSNLILPVGTYEFTLVDSAGCEKSEEITIEDNGEILPQAVVTNTMTPSAQNGSIVIDNIDGGTAPFEYLWSTGASGNSIDNLGEGTYELTITDSIGCEWYGSFVIEADASSLGEILVNDFLATLFPNPSDGKAVFIKIENPVKEGMELNLYDLAGRNIQNLNFDIVPNQFKLPQIQNAGFYLLELKAENGNRSLLKLVVE
ncbi:MAG: DUF6055 domain-containing protein [Saprospiraceae bacterium]